MGDATGEKAGEFMVQLAKDVDDGKVEVSNLKQEELTACRRLRS